MGKSVWISLLVGSLVACGGSSRARDAGGGPGDAGLSDGGVADGGVADGGPSDGGPGDGGFGDAGHDGGLDSGSTDGGTGDCTSEIAALQPVLSVPGESCSVVIRLDHVTLAILGYQVFCGRDGRPTESSARATAQTDTGYGAGGRALNPTSPEDTFVFYEAPGDFGGASAVNARNGLSVFGGSIIWSGTGEITYPDSWLPPPELGDACPAVGSDISARGYDLLSGGTLGPDEVAAALAVVTRTAVPAAYWGGGYVFDAVVLRYPRSVGAFNPATAEWVVILNGGWLE